jgi:hypothetical protein
VLSTVQGDGSIFLLVLGPVLVALQDCEQNPRKGRMTEKAQLDNWIDDIVAFHKGKRVFIKLKEMESEDLNHF